MLIHLPVVTFLWKIEGPSSSPGIGTCPGGWEPLLYGPHMGKISVLPGPEQKARWQTLVSFDALIVNLSQFINHHFANEGLGFFSWIE